MDTSSSKRHEVAEFVPVRFEQDFFACPCGIHRVFQFIIISKFNKI